MTVGEKIKATRESRQMTQEQLGCLCGTTKQTIFKYENNIVTNIPLDKLERIAGVLSVSPSYLMGWDEQKPTPGPESGQHINIVKIAGRDGSYKEKRLTDEQIKALQTIIDQMPEAPEDL